MTDLEMEELEFAVRAYEVSTEHLLAVLAKIDPEPIPARIEAELMALADSINEEWG